MTNLITTWQSAHRFSDTSKEAREVFSIEMRLEFCLFLFSTAFGLCRMLGIERKQIDQALSQAAYESDSIDLI
jgi:hypothetical protein